MIDLIFNQMIKPSSAILVLASLLPSVKIWPESFNLKVLQKSSLYSDSSHGQACLDWDAPVTTVCPVIFIPLATAV